MRLFNQINQSDAMQISTVPAVALTLQGRKLFLPSFLETIGNEREFVCTFYY